MQEQVQSQVPKICKTEAAHVAGKAAKAAVEFKRSGAYWLEVSFAGRSQFFSWD